ncbi:hypothetical protein PYCC9005_001144 [Savitreella phatthalungensis]
MAWLLCFFIQICSAVLRTQDNAVWPLERISTTGPLQNIFDADAALFGQRSKRDTVFKYTYDSRGMGDGVDIIVIGPRIDQFLSELGGYTGRASFPVNPLKQDGSLEWPETGNSVGTAVAGAAGGVTIGVAKRASILSVEPPIQAPQSAMIRLARFLLQLDGERRNSVGTVVVLAWSGVDATPATTAAFRKLSDYGIHVVAGAGNWPKDTCATNLYRSLENTVVVAASSWRDEWWPQNGFGTCVSLVAPGDGVPALLNEESQEVRGGGGNSMLAFMQSTAISAGFTAGVIATWLSMGILNDAQTLPENMKAWLIQNAEQGAIHGVPDGTRNALLKTVVVSGGASSASSSPISRL